MKTFNGWILLLLMLPGCCWALRCYQCGAGDGDMALACDLFTRAPIWRPFEVECPSSPPHYCAKTASHSHDDEDEPREVVRGCAPAENAFQAPNPLGCRRTGPFSPTVLCLCDTHLCNPAARLSPPPLLAFLTVFVSCLRVM